MRSFASLLPARPSSLLALSAQFLDRAGADADAIREGVTIVECPDILVTDVCDAIDELVFNEESSRGWSMEDDGKAILLDGGTSDGKFKRALASGRTLIVVSPAARLPTDADVHQDRRYAIDGDLCDSIVKNVIEAVTGGDVPNAVARGLSRGLDASTLTATVRPTISASDAVDRLRKLAEKADAKADKADRDLSELAKLAKGDDDAVPLSDAAAKVVVRLRDLHGYGAAKDFGMQLSEDIRAYKAGKLDWSEIDKGLLLSGAPGTGKTYFASALAAECEVPLIVMTYADMESKTGSGNLIAKAIKQLFADARKKAPCIVFIDELDSVQSRSNRDHNSSWFTGVVNSLLAELDGADDGSGNGSRPGVVVIGETNFPDRCDPALLRPGRLEAVIDIPLPDRDSIGKIIQHHGVTVGDLDAAAVALRGQSPAQIAHACRVARRAARKAGRTVSADDVVDAARAARPQRDDADDASIRLHEAAHAVVASAVGVDFRYVDADKSVTCVMGKSMLNKGDVEDRIVVALAARRADAILGGGPDSGAVSDLALATALARNAIARWGLTGSVYAYGDTEAELSRDIRVDVADWLETLDIRAAKFVDANRDAILAVADALRVRRYLDADEVRAIVKGTGPSLS